MRGDRNKLVEYDELVYVRSFIDPRFKFVPRTNIFISIGISLIPSQLLEFDIPRDPILPAFKLHLRSKIV